MEVRCVEITLCYGLPEYDQGRDREIYRFRLIGTLEPGDYDSLPEINEMFVNSEDINMFKIGKTYNFVQEII